MMYYVKCGYNACIYFVSSTFTHHALIPFQFPVTDGKSLLYLTHFLRLRLPRHSPTSCMIGLNVHSRLVLALFTTDRLVL